MQRRQAAQSGRAAADSHAIGEGGLPAMLPSEPRLSHLPPAAAAAAANAANAAAAARRRPPPPARPPPSSPPRTLALASTLT